ncbi:MAG: sugar phosphate isomerase/epimerase [Gammaproteobacteria bacterium]|nr:sugar phosphate isomerase/epimerase [Gammaproteobacteria bacterium]MDE2263884.1 sugar phosphate isomerase/epimerase [Gammaproteobacteria bacterium]
MEAAAPEFSLAHLTLLHCAPPELTEIAARAGYDYVSYRPISLGLATEPKYPLASDRRLLERTKAALRATGIRLLDIELARILPGVDVTEYLPALEAAAELGGRHVLSSVWCEDMSFARDRFAQLCELARPLGLTVDLEFVTFAGVRTLSEAAGLVAASGCANAGICIDTLHFDRSGCKVQDLERLPREWFHYAQICDAPEDWSAQEQELKRVAREERLFLGEGGIDVRAILDHMPRIPYSLELPNARLLAALGPVEFARRCLETARRHLSPPRARPTPDRPRPRHAVVPTTLSR